MIQKPLYKIEIGEAEMQLTDLPIQAHPRFAEFVGTAKNPKNGALFCKKNGQWKSFGRRAPASWRGVTNYTTWIQNVVTTVVVPIDEYLDYTPRALSRLNRDENFICISTNARVVGDRCEIVSVYTRHP